MIIEQNVLIFIKNKQAQTHYKNKGYNSEIGNFLSFPVNCLSENAHTKVKVQCEICNSKLDISYSKYNLNIKRYGFYSCKKCSEIKRKKTVLIKYNVEHISQTETNRNKMSKFMKSDKFKNKSKETQLIKYNGHYSKTDEFKLKTKNTYLLKSDLEKQNIKDKQKQICLLKYGVEYPLMNKDIYNKARLTMLNRYGVKFSMQSKIILDKQKQTFFKKYGTYSVLSSKDIRNKIIKTKINKGIITDYNIWSKIDFKKYKRRIRYLTNKKYELLKENWNGYDFYDNSYIKNNYHLPYTHGLYPTIDHKISIHKSFLLNKTIDEVCDINNLCITTRSNNSKKNNKNDFKN